MHQAHNRVIWFATQKGVSVFDGNNWESFHDSLGLPSVSKVFLKSTPDHSMWIAGYTNDSFVIKKYKNHRWYNIVQPLGTETWSDELATFHFEVFLQNNVTYLLIVRGPRYFIYSDKTKKWLELHNQDYPQGLTNYKVISKETGFWILSDKGVFEIEYSSNKLKKVRINGLRDGKIVCNMAFHPKKKNDYILMGDNWIAQVSDKQFRKLSDNIGIHLNVQHISNNLVIDEQGRVFYSFNSGIRKLDIETGEWTSMQSEDENMNYNCEKILLDNEGNVWGATYRGVVKFDKHFFRYYSKQSGLWANEVTALIERCDGSVFLGSNLGYSLIQPDDQIDKYSFKQNEQSKDMANYRLLDLVQTSDCGIYVAGNYLGLGKLTPNGRLDWLPKIAPPDDKKYLASALLMKEDTLWIAFSNKIYTLKNGNLQKKYNLPAYVRKIFMSSDKKLYFLTINGLYIQEEGIREIKPEKLEETSFYSMIETKQKQILIGTLRGIFELKNNELVSYKINGKHIDDPVYALLIDSKDNIWIGTNYGVYCYNNASKVLKHFHSENALIGDEVNRNALKEFSDGTIWIGTDRGVNIYNPKNGILSNTSPLLEITSIQNQKKKIRYDLSKEIKLKATSSHLIFFFRTVLFSHQDNISYRVRLKNYDKEWVIVKNYKQNFIRYTGLPAGRYQFQVQIREGDNDWSKTVFSPWINVYPPFYQTWWFISLEILAVIMILVNIYYIRINYLKRQNNLLARKVEVRTKELIEANRQLTVQKQEISEQAEEIITINSHLEQQVKKRTKQLEQQNQQLIDYAFFNSHKIRAPLARIMGLVSLLRHNLVSDSEKENILERIEVCANELDSVIRQINQVLEKS